MAFQIGLAKSQNFKVASRAGIEPATPGLGNLCSIHLSYRKNAPFYIQRGLCLSPHQDRESSLLKEMVDEKGIEPSTFGLQSRHSPIELLAHLVYSRGSPTNSFSGRFSENFISGGTANRTIDPHQNHPTSSNLLSSSPIFGRQLKDCTVFSPIAQRNTGLGPEGHVLDLKISTI